MNTTSLSLAAAALVALASPATAQLSRTINLVDVGGAVPGVTFNGINPLDYSGYSVSSAGDVNGDDLADMLIGAYGAAQNGELAFGKTFLIYGSANLPGSFDLASADVTFNGIDFLDSAGYSVSSAGDVNGDGLADLLIGAYMADPHGNAEAGETYLIYGSASLPASVGLANADVRFNGINAFNRSGFAVSSAGDFNGDGLADLLIGAQVGPRNVGDFEAGETYLIYGGTSLPASFDLANADVTFKGVNNDDFAGTTISSAGDVNGDGLADLLIGAELADPNGDTAAGETYLVYGRAGLAGSFNLAAANVRFSGIDAFDGSGHSVSSAGDVNGDGLADMLIGNRTLDPNDNSETYLIYGSANLGGSFDLANANVTFHGIDAHDGLGLAVSSAGDVNGDGLADLLIGDSRADSNGNADAGEIYLIFGSASLPGSFNLEDANILFNGISTGDHAGNSVSSAGDVNGDGVADLLIGAPSRNSHAGSAYLVYGPRVPEPAALALALLAAMLTFAARSRRPGLSPRVRLDDRRCRSRRCGCRRAPDRGRRRACRRRRRRRRT